MPRNTRQPVTLSSFVACQTPQLLISQQCSALHVSLSSLFLLLLVLWPSHTRSHLRTSKSSTDHLRLLDRLSSSSLQVRQGHGEPTVQADFVRQVLTSAIPAPTCSEQKRSLHGRSLHFQWPFDLRNLVSIALPRSCINPC